MSEYHPRHQAIKRIAFGLQMANEGKNETKRVKTEINAHHYSLILFPCQHIHLAFASFLT